LNNDFWVINVGECRRQINVGGSFLHNGLQITPLSSAHEVMQSCRYIDGVCAQTSLYVQNNNGLVHTQWETIMYAPYTHQFIKHNESLYTSTFDSLW
jgi:hypothetical protein